jgi:hypothetical protein
MDELLLLRLGLLAILLLFTLVVAMSMSRGLRSGAMERVPSRQRRAALSVIAPSESGLAMGTSFELAGVITLGRDAGNSIVLADASVSGRHAMLRQVGDQWTLRDLGSTNGTFVEQRQLNSDAIQLRGGERITVGAVVFRFER